LGIKLSTFGIKKLTSNFEVINKAQTFFLISNHVYRYLRDNSLMDLQTNYFSPLPSQTFLSASNKRAGQDRSKKPTLCLFASNNAIYSISFLDGKNQSKMKNLLPAGPHHIFKLDKREV